MDGCVGVGKVSQRAMSQSPGTPTLLLLLSHAPPCWRATAADNMLQTRGPFRLRVRSSRNTHTSLQRTATSIPSPQQEVLATPLAMVASRYYLDYRTMKLFQGCFGGEGGESATSEHLCRLLADAQVCVPPCLCVCSLLFFR